MLGSRHQVQTVKCLQESGLQGIVIPKGRIPALGLVREEDAIVLEPQLNGSAKTMMTITNAIDIPKETKKDILDLVQGIAIDFDQITEKRSMEGGTPRAPLPHPSKKKSL